MNDSQQSTSLSPRRGEAKKAALLSALVIPGAGQWYNGQWLKGAAVMVLFLVCSLVVLYSVSLALIVYYLNLSTGNIDNAGGSLQDLIDGWFHLAVLVLASIGFYVYSVVDAYKVRLRKISVEQAVVDCENE